MEVHTPLPKLRCLEAIHGCPLYNNNFQSVRDSSVAVAKLCSKRTGTRNFANRISSSQLVDGAFLHQQRVQNQPFKLYYEDNLRVHGADLQTTGINRPKALRFKSFSPPQKDNRVSLVPIAPDLKTLLCRPTVAKADPLTDDEDYFQYLISYPDLKPITFDDDPVRTLKFYQENYPLLLKKLSLQEAANIVLTRKRIRTPETAMQRHRAVLRMRKGEMERKLKELEKTSDEIFITVLRHVVFDPDRWPWNEEIAKHGVKAVTIGSELGY